MLMIGCLACQTSPPQKLSIATAANMQFSMEALVEAFTQKTGFACETIISSSGKLTAQIKEGAPYDVFVSANMKYPNELFQSGLTSQAPEVYAYGQLVLWSMSQTLTPSLDNLAQPTIRHIAIANPKTAPYGIAALEVLQKQPLYSTVKDKLVYGESIAQTNQFIVSKSAELGFTAKSVVLSSKMKGQGLWIEMEDNSYTPIEQGVVLIKRQGQKSISEKAQQFYAFLFSAEAQQILENHGYLVPQQ